MKLIAGALLLLLLAAVGGTAALFSYGVSEPPSWIADLRPFAASEPPRDEPSPPPGPAWVASAPGRVEPLSGEVRIDALAPGRVTELLVAVGDRVEAGDLIARIEDEEADARLVAAEAQVALRKQDRDGAPTPRGALAELRKAQDGVADAERALAAARRRQERAAAERGDRAALAAAREEVAEARRRLETARAELARRAADTNKSQDARDINLTIARARLGIAEAAIEKTRVRAPFAGTILQTPVHAGEIAGTGMSRPLAVIADLARLRVRVDLDERNRAQVSLGQAVLVRSESLAEAAKGRVAAIAPALVPAQAHTGSRRRPQSGSVVEVLVDIADPAPLIPGMQVDVYFLAPDAG
jgi:HlyD family secretion protein